MERDFIGYGPNVPKVVWPQHGQIAVNFVLNYEEGGESSLLDGEGQSESYLTDLPGAVPVVGGRHLSVESIFEYGSRVGVFRLLKLFEEFEIPLTVFAVGLALKRNPPLCKILRESPHEIAGHGYRWINYGGVDENVERQHIQETLQIIQTHTGKTPIGWYTGRKSANTRKLIVENGIRYDSDSLADDLPYWVKVEGRHHLVIPYNLDANDCRYGMVPGWNSGDDFLSYLKASFDYLYREGESSPKMMTIGLHARFSGRPGRAEAVRRFIEYIKGYRGVWICRREDIYNYWCKSELRH